MRKPEIKIKNGDRFGRWTILSEAESHIQPNDSAKKMYLCKCDCGNVKKVQAQSLRSGDSVSCGCLAKEIASLTHKKRNEFFFEDGLSYGITTNTNEKFFFDEEDYNTIKNFAWFSYNGYITTNNYIDKNYPRLLKMHRLVMQERNPNVYIDHINHNTMDNRKCNLRATTPSQNARNHKVSKSNTSGVTGVILQKTNQKWRAAIRVDYKTIALGTYDTFEEAVKARKNAEQLYFGDYSYDKSLKIQNGKDITYA